MRETQNRRTSLHLIAALVSLALWTAVPLRANHPVLVEGNNCSNGAPGTGTVPAGTCGDYDGDGRIGTAEDTDNADDRIFGTIGAALGAANGGANQNGRVTIVTSGRFAEVVQITGNVTLEAAPGVEANVEAFLAGAPENPDRAQVPGIIINSPSNRYVIVRNIISRNWTDGIQVRGDSRVTIDNCRIENNTNFGIKVGGNARVAILNTQVNATGFRLNPASGDFPTTSNPAPGHGIQFEDSSSGLVTGTSVIGSFGAGIANFSRGSVTIADVALFDNNPDVR